MEASPQPVLYFDAEISDLQFRHRYEGIKFHDHFYRLTLNQEQTTGGESYNLLLQNIVQEALSTNAKVIIIDNMTFLLKGNINPIPFLIKLKTIKNQLGLTFLLVSHTPKLAKGKPITVNDLYGSKNISNFVDSVFAIGASNQGESYRYLKQLKARNSEIIYGYSNVAICEVKKTDMIRFEFRGFALEEDHLVQQVRSRNREPKPLDLEIIDMISRHPDFSNEKIAKLLETNRMKVKRVRDKHNL